MPFRKGEVTNPNGTSGHRGGPGAPPNWFRSECKRRLYTIDVPAFWESIVRDEKQNTRDRMEAALKLTEFAEGKAHQSVGVEYRDDTARIPTVELQERNRRTEEAIARIEGILGRIEGGSGVETSK